VVEGRKMEEREEDQEDEREDGGPLLFVSCLVPCRRTGREIKKDGTREELERSLYSG
jgi:hypothetical protein